MIEFILVFLIGAYVGHRITYPYNLQKEVSLKERDYAIKKKLLEEFGVK